MRIRFLTMLATVCAVLLSSAKAQVTRPALGRNAALLYYQAFEYLPRQENHFAIVGRHSRVMQYVRLAARIPQCDWGLPVDEFGPNTVMPHVNYAKDLADVALRDAAYWLEEDKGSLAVEDIAAAMTLARHVGSDQILVSYLVQCGIEQKTFDFLGQRLKELDAGQLRELARLLGQLPAGASLSECMAKQKRLNVGWMIDRISKASEPVDWPKVLDVLDVLPGQVDAAVKRVGGSKEAVLKNLRMLESDCDEASRILAQPLPIAMSKVAPVLARMSANPAAGFVFGGYDKAMERVARNQIEMEMLKAAIAVLLDGREKVREHADPFGDGPFGYREIAGGFELESRFKVADKPVTFRVSPPAPRWPRPSSRAAGE